jgi:hypothetical protein
VFNVGDSVGVYRCCSGVPPGHRQDSKVLYAGAEMADALSKGEFEMFGDLGAEYSVRLLVISDWVSRPIFLWLQQPLPDDNIGKRICYKIAVGWLSDANMI